MVTQPAKAVILLFPITDSYEQKRREEDARIAAEGQHPIDPTVFWMKQTISNACGTMALLHALINSDVAFAPESPIEKFIDICKAARPPSPPTSTPTCTSPASSRRPPRPPDVDGTPVTEGGMRLLELDGRRVGPIDRGECKDFLKDVAKVVRNLYVAHTASMHFSMIALCGGPSPDA
ncbi:hypothetical protein BN946_scf184969.g14 [Trametes cinnabarina]|uniref:Ubiquitin carboxyl-terminal hydrolase n=1 Tax=Pycnoporus cinnabarinus TaxID=5643 RepID=A0A060SYM8_PYCCI|nr:hypothetical protein BN946_scf184969.g14 [Trametes cinnabarina]